MVVNRTEGRGIAERLVKVYKRAIKRWISSGDLMPSLVIIANNTALFLEVAKRLDLNCSGEQLTLIVWCGGGIGWCYSGNHTAISSCVKSTHLKLTQQYVNYISIRLEKNWMLIWIKHPKIQSLESSQNYRTHTLITVNHTYKATTKWMLIHGKY